MPRMSTAASAASAEPNSATGWPGAADHQFSSMRILGSCFGLRYRSLLISPSGRIGRRQTRGFTMRSRALLLALLVVAASILTAVEAKAAGTVYIYNGVFRLPRK
jgi:hypothetical protein